MSELKKDSLFWLPATALAVVAFVSLVAAYTSI